MNKASLAQKLSERLNVSRKIAEDFIHAFQDVVTETLADDEEVTIAGFGTFSSRIRAARKGVNPRKPAETINVPAVKVPKFKAGKALKDSLKASMGRPAVKDSAVGAGSPSPAKSAVGAGSARPPSQKPVGTLPATSARSATEKPAAPATPITPPPAEMPPKPPVPPTPQKDTPKPNNPLIHM